MSLEAIAKVVDEYLPQLKKVSKDATINRLVCGSCLDFKLMTTVPLQDFGPWEEKGFAPEADFLKKISAIDGVSLVETQVCMRFAQNIVIFSLRCLASAWLDPSKKPLLITHISRCSLGSQTITNMEI